MKSSRARLTSQAVSAPVSKRNSPAAAFLSTRDDVLGTYVPVKVAKVLDWQAPIIDADLGQMIR